MPREIFQYTSETTSGTSTTGSALAVKRWLTDIVDAAKARKFFEQACAVIDLPKGTKDMVQPYRTAYLATMTDTTTESTAVAWTEFTNLNGVTLTPATHAYGIALSNHALRTNAVNLISAAREELTEYAARTVDTAISTALLAATETTTAGAGAQTLFGGTATTYTSLAKGDVLTSELVADARERLMSTKPYYWSGSTYTASSAAKPPWYPTASEPFMLFIAPEQESALNKDSQFTNACEYGSNEVVMNGEIGKYLGFKVIETSQVTADATTVAGHKCLAVKKGACAALGWGYNGKMRLNVFDFPSNLETRLIMENVYHASALHDTAIVEIGVADQLA